MKRVVTGVMRHPHTGEFFIARRSGTRYPGCWETPGGKIEFGESETDALIREWAEELGVNINGRIGHKIGDFTVFASPEAFQIAAYWVIGDELPNPGNSHDMTIWAYSSDIETIPENFRVPSLLTVIRACGGVGF